MGSKNTLTSHLRGFHCVQNWCTCHISPSSSIYWYDYVSTQPRCENNCCWFCHRMAGKYCEHSHTIYIQKWTLLRNVQFIGTVLHQTTVGNVIPLNELKETCKWRLYNALKLLCTLTIHSIFVVQCSLFIL